MNDEPTGDWAIYSNDEVDDGPCLWQIRSSLPVDFQPGDFPVSVVVEYRYADGGRPTSANLAELHEFESHLDLLNDARGNSVLVHVIRGDGASELCYYCRSYERFMDQLNLQLQGKRPYPIQVVWQHDPSWTYWEEIKSELGGDDV